MENFQQMMTQAAHIKEQELKTHRKSFERLPEFLKAGLAYHKKYTHLRNQPFLVQFFISEILKKQGNNEILKHEYESAFHKYEESLAIFRYIEAKTNQNLKDQDLIYHMYEPKVQYAQMLGKHLNSLYLNISLCAIKQNKKQQALISADQALKIDKNNPKSYYRKSQAHLQNINRSDEDIKQGLKYLQLTYQLSKQEEIHREIIKMKRLIQEENKKAKQTFKFMINNNNNRQSVLSDNIKYKSKQEIKILKKGNSRSAQKKKQQTTTYSEKNGIKKQITEKNNTRNQQNSSKNSNTQTINSHNSINTNHNTKQSKLVEKNLNEIKLKQVEKQLKTQRKLLKMLESQKWELTLLQNTITKKGQKILTLLEVYNYKEYIQDYKTIFRKCMSLHKKSGLKTDSYKTEQGQQITIDFQQAQVKDLFDQQKLKIYNEYIQWLRKHPIPEINKYLERYQNQKKFLDQKYKQKQEKKVSKVIQGGTDDKESPSNLIFYSAALLILVWMAYNIYRNLFE